MRFTRGTLIPLALSAGVIALVFSQRKKSPTAGPVGPVPPAATTSPEGVALSKLPIHRCGTNDCRIYNEPRVGPFYKPININDTFRVLESTADGWTRVLYPAGLLPRGRATPNAIYGWIPTAKVVVRLPTPGPEDEAVDFGTVTPQTSAEAELTDRYNVAIAYPLTLDGVPIHVRLRDDLRNAAASSNPTQTKNFTDSADQLQARLDALFRFIADDAIALAQRALTIEEAARAIPAASILSAYGYGAGPGDRGNLAAEVINAVATRQAVLRA